MSLYLEHYGTPRHSGRYPWGSGKTPFQRTQDFRATVQKLKKDGLSETEIARELGISTTQLRARVAIAKNEKRKADESMAMRLKDKGYSNVKIGERMGINESSVRDLLNPTLQERADILRNTANALKEAVEEKNYIDIGAGTELYLGVKNTKLRTAVAMLEEEGYKIQYVKVEQLGTGKETTIKVLTKEDVPYSELSKHRYEIEPPTCYSEDGGRTFGKIEPPKSISSKRVAVAFAEDGGNEKDGVIELRRGVDDISLGGSKYAQVRIAVDGSHYLKGMAMYADDLPDGVDIRFNTSKHKGTPLKATDKNVESVFKEMKPDKNNPFGALIRRQKGVINIVNEEGAWDNWSRTLSSQFLSKQPLSLAKRQLGIDLDFRKEQLDEIMALTNPVVKKKLLKTFADEADSAAVHLKAAAMPRQRTQVILPIKSLKDNEIYAPNFRNGENVVLVRHPHGGIFEIPELTVNNRNKEGKSILGQAIDAVGINSRVAARLSGADFDGDSVLVIPNKNGAIKSHSSLKALKDFDPKEAYSGYKGMKVMTKKQKGQEMGKVSNLITDMTIKGAGFDEIARAVRHSMVVIDAEKHKLNWKQSEIDNGIKALKEKYQGGANKGASTLISKASSEARVAERKDRPISLGGSIDPATGKKMYVETGNSYISKKTGKEVFKTTKSTKMYEVSDAHKLSSGTKMEEAYANYANECKALGNKARKASLNVPSMKYSKSAKETYASEVSSLAAKLNVAKKNAPLERKAQLIANQIIKTKKELNPDMDAEDLKKIKGQALIDARSKTGAHKQRITISDKEWAAIQAGAVSEATLSSILDNTDLDKIKKLATPRSEPKVSSAKLARAKTLLKAGNTQSEVADFLGIPLSTLKEALIK